MYLTESETGDGVAVVGSSNFTRSGLGYGAGANVEINLATGDREACTELQQWFDELWADRELTEDVKPAVLDALNRIGRDHAPELVYYKTLYELFREDIEARQSGERQLSDTHVYDSAVWNALYDFQKDGAKSVIARLLRHNGCILADSVGLGKTYTALAVIKFFELRNERVLVLCPKKLRENWALYPAHTAHTNNPFYEDRFGYTLLSHTDLSRATGKAGDIDLAQFNWRNFDLVVIDESHNFRNATASRRDETGANRSPQPLRALTGRSHPPGSPNKSTDAFGHTGQHLTDRPAQSGLSDDRKAGRRFPGQFGHRQYRRAARAGAKGVSGLGIRSQSKRKKR